MSYGIAVINELNYITYFRICQHLFLIFCNYFYFFYFIPFSPLYSHKYLSKQKKDVLFLKGHLSLLLDFFPIQSGQNPRNIFYHFDPIH